MLGLGLITLLLIRLRTIIVPKFDEFPAIGWLVCTTISILIGITIGNYACSTHLDCHEIPPILYAQAISLVAGISIFIGLAGLTEWWVVWGDLYRIGYWLTGLLAGVSVAAVLALLGIYQLIVPFSIITAAFIITKGQNGDSFYQRRLIVAPLGLLMAGIFTFTRGSRMTPPCLCFDDINDLINRWLSMATFIGGLHGLIWLYLWQTAPQNAQSAGK